jgi:TPP-dependent 2-oxoacid decarboxylase
MYEKMAAHITAATLVLKNQATAAEDIDRVLTTMMIESRPVYIGLSVDVGYLEVDDSHLKTPLAIELPPNDPSVEKKVVEGLRVLLEKANHPSIIVDGSKSRSNGSIHEANSRQTRFATTLYRKLQNSPSSLASLLSPPQWANHLSMKIQRPLAVFTAGRGLLQG